MFRAIIVAVTGVLGVGAYVLIALLFLLSIPLGMLAIMRLTGWEWWTSILALVGVSIVPFLGQLAGVGLTFVGAYFFVDAGFNWEVASGQRPKVVAATELTEEDLQKYRIGLQPTLTKQCESEMSKQLGGANKITVEMQNFCKCYVSAALDALTVEEIRYQKDNDRPSDQFTKALGAQSQACW